MVDCFTDSESNLFLVTEQTKDGNLKDFLNRTNKVLEEREVKVIAKALVDTLVGLHMCEIYHGNISTASVYLKLGKYWNSGFQVKLGGFDRARVLTYDAARPMYDTLTQDIKQLGTLLY